jgi:hypothetical protein
MNKRKETARAYYMAAILFIVAVKQTAIYIQYRHDKSVEIFVAKMLVWLFIAFLAYQTLRYFHAARKLPKEG